MPLLNDLKTKFIPLLASEIEKELKAQGHIDTGKITNTAQNIAKQVGDDIMIQGFYEDYSRYLENGVSASSIAKAKFATVAINALEAWAKRKGFDQPRSAAYAIRQTQAREGMPTRGSYRYTSNGRRKQFAETVLQSAKVSDGLNSVIGKSIERTLTNIIAQAQKEAAS